MALVITIIVMIILAGVSISAVVGENGIIKQSKKAATMQELEKFKEDVNTLYMTELANGQDEVSPAQLKEKLASDYEYNVTESSKITAIKFKRKETQKTIDSVTIKKGEESAELTAEIVKDAYYVNLKGMYYSFEVKNDKVVIGDPVTDIPDSAATSEGASTITLTAPQGITLNRRRPKF